jgi:hypothetical protein
MQTYIRHFGSPTFDFLLFDSSSARWGAKQGGLVIHAPQEISEVRPDCLLVSNYKFQQEIYDSLLSHRELGIEIVKLHLDDDVPWLY